MIPGDFDYVVTSGAPETVTLLKQHGDEARLFPGGHSLISLLRSRLAAPSVLLDIHHVSELEYMQEVDGTLRIGALTREAALDAPLIRSRYPILTDTTSGSADSVVRNWATIGGNLAHADPASGHPATMLALGASIVATGPGGQRIIPIAEFFTTATFETTLRSNEMLTEIRVPVPVERSGGAYCKLERRVGNYALAGVAACVTLDKDGIVTAASIGLTNVEPYPMKACKVEQALIGRMLDEDSMHSAAALAAATTQPVNDLRGPIRYKRAMVHALCVGALSRAAARALANS